MKKWNVFYLFTIWAFVIWGVTVISMYIENGVDPDIIPLNSDQIGYVIAVVAGGSIIAIFIFMFLGVGVISYFKEGKDRERILKEGESVKAKIIKLDEDDDSIVTVNEQPFVNLTLEIYNGDKKPYQVKLKTLIPRLSIPQFQENKYLWVKIDPLNPNKIVIDPENFSLNQSTDANLVGVEHWSEEERKIMKAEGIEGEAEILKVEETGNKKGSEVEVRVYYKVKASNIESYEVDGTLYYHPKVAEFVKSKVGSTVPARINPRERNKVILRFGEVFVDNDIK